MAKSPTRTLNPALAHHRSQKARTIKKSKTALQAQRAEKLARRNPERLQRQIDELKAAETKGEVSRPRDRQVLEGLERDVGAIRKAREKVGYEHGEREGERRRDGDGQRNGGGGERRGRGESLLGKRRRDSDRDQDGESSSTTTDEDVRRIPMPRDTPPPIPRQHSSRHSTNANHTPLGDARTQPHPLPAKPAVVAPAQTTYAAAPQVRNLIQEATKKFVPAAVLAARKGRGAGGRLIEPEEADAMEAEAKAQADAQTQATHGQDGLDDEEDVLLRLQEEEERFKRELQSLQTQPDAANAHERRQALAREAMHDAEELVEAAVEEAQHFMIEQEVVEGLGGGGLHVEDTGDGEGSAEYEARQAEKALRGVEVEEVEDEDL